MLNSKVLHFIFSISCFLTFNFLFAQSPNFKHFTVEDGLPSSECYQVLQDKKGYIWIATDKGVARYDGVKFQHFTKEDGLPENCIIRMYEDPKGRIWFAGVSNKIAYFENNKISCLKINNQFSQKKEFGIINSMAFCHNTLWIGMYGTSSIYKVTFSKEKNSNTLSSKKNNLSKKQKLIEINQYKKIVGTYIIKLENDELIQGFANFKGISYTNIYFITPTKNYSTKNAFSTIVGDLTNVRITACTDKHYLLNYNNNIVKINHRNGKTIQKMFVNQNINYSLSDSKNGIWLGTNKNGVLYYPKGDIENSIPFQFLKNKTVSCIMEDREHGFWISTIDDGIFYLKDIHFFHLTKLSSKKVNTLLYHDSTLFAGLDNGYIVHFRNSILTETNANAIPFNINFITKITPYTTHSIAVGSTNGFGYMDLKTNTCSWIKTYFPPLLNIKSIISTVFFIKSKEKNTYWIAHYTSLIKVFDNNKTKHIPFKHRIYSLAEDDQGILWLGGVNGLYCYHKGAFVFHGKKSIALSGRINDLQIKNNTLWAATKNDGVTIKKGNQLYDITTKNGLNSNICQSVFLESEKIGWVATNKGVSKITVTNWKPFKIKVKAYSSSNGLISNEVNDITKHGNIVYIASNKGVTWFNEQKVKPNRTAPPIYITDVEINNSDTTVFSTYHLPYHKNKISFNFIGLTYKSESNVEYKYRLRGLDNTWTNFNYAKANFYNLSHGDYTFEVIAKNNDGYWSKNPARIDFIISPPFWHTWPFRIIAGISFLASIYFFIKWRISKVEKRALENSRLYQQTVEMEMKFLSSQMNPHFTFNAMNSIQYYMLENEPEKAQKYLVKYSKLIRKVLENNMKKYVPISEEVEMLGLYMDIESVRFEIQFEYEIQISEEVKTMNISIPPMIVQPYIENAIWHGISHKKEIQGKITISYQLLEDKIKCSVEDNGIGRKKSKELKTGKTNKESLGMLITHQRLQQLHSESEMDIEPEIIDLVDENGEDCGTKVVIYLPFVSLSN